MTHPSSEGHLHDLGLQRAHIEVEISHLLVLKIGPGEKYFGEFLVRPSPSRSLSCCGDETLIKPVELDSGM